MGLWSPKFPNAVRYKLPYKMVFHPEKTAQVMLSVCLHARAERYPNVLDLDLVDGKLVFVLDRPLTDDEAVHIGLDDSEIMR